MGPQEKIFREAQITRNKLGGATDKSDSGEFENKKNNDFS